MAAPTGYGNVLILADGNTIAAPAKLCAIKVVAGSAAATLTLTSGDGNSTVFYSSGQVATNTSQLDHDLDIQLKAGDTCTVGLSGTGATAYIYLG